MKYTRRMLTLLAVAGMAFPALAQPDKKDFPDFKDVAKDFEKVISTTDDNSFYTIWKRDKDGQMLAELPRGWSNQKHFFAMTVAAGEEFAGLQGADFVVQWKRFDDRIALIEPNFATRTSGDTESQDAVDIIYTDRVILDVPIVCMGPGGQPVIDLDDLLIGRITTFFGGSGGGANARLATISKAKSFPENTEIAVTLPVSGGFFKTFHYSLSLLKGTPGYKPRVADSRVGFFTTDYRDLGELDTQKLHVRYINRWNLEKRDKNLKLSPPKEPIVYYIDHTVPVRYRRFVRQGLEYWNKAYENVGILNAIEVRQQDKMTGAYMDIDPEDCRYNFVRWVTNETGLAIGPSRANPYTGEILDADVVVSDGWVRAWEFEFSDIMPKIMMEGFAPETLAWLDENPQWDPRYRMASKDEQRMMLSERARRGVMPYGGHPIATAIDAELSAKLNGGVLDRMSTPSGFCQAAVGKAFDMSIARMTAELGMFDDDKEAEVEKIDGMPEDFLGPLLADLIAHEVGHTLGLRHNFKASSLYSLDEINSDAVKGKKSFAASVMDYLPTNFNVDDTAIQGDYAMIDIGPYDMWAMEYGYTQDEKSLPDLLKRSNEPELQYATDEDTSGPDPLARRYDFTAEPLDFAKSQIKHAELMREKILSDFVKDGEPWTRARRGYQITLNMQARASGLMANWIGGAFVNRDKKGDNGGRTPINVVDPDIQRAALKFVMEHTFRDDAYAITPELLQHMTVEKWWDDNSAMQDSTWPIHDRISAVQAGTLTQMMNPTTIRRVYDNEFYTPADQDAVTVPELLGAISAEVWSELDQAPRSKVSDRAPMISSLRRNLQRELTDRLVDLTGPNGMPGSAGKPVSNLAMVELRNTHARINDMLQNNGKKLDSYTSAHLQETKLRIEQVMNAQYVYNQSGSGDLPFFFFGDQPQQATPVEVKIIEVPVPYIPSPTPENGAK